MDNDVILYLSTKFEIYLNLCDYFSPFDNDIMLYVKESIQNIYYNLLDDRNILLSGIHFKGNQLIANIKYNGKKQNIIILPYINSVPNEIKNLNYLINIKDDIDITQKIELHNNFFIVCNTIIIMDIIKLLCYGFEISEELEKYILENIDEIKINFKENKLSDVSKILFKLNYDKFGSLIDKKNYIYEILFDIDYNHKLIESINPKKMIELYVSILYDKYFIIDDINKINMILILYEMDNSQILFVRSVFEILKLLNIIGINNSLKIGKIIKRFQYVEKYTVRYSIQLYNNIFNESYDINKILTLMDDELLKKFVSYKNLDIPKYKYNIQKYQNVMTYVYGELYNLKNYDWILLENMFNKYMVKLKV